jgi:GAG-pre-integrase domain
MAEQANKLSRLQSNSMKADNLVAFIIEKAQHYVINDERTKMAKLALAACTKKQGKPKGKRKEKGQSDVTCENCNRPGHAKLNCWSKGGGKEGQGLRQKKKTKEPKTVVVAADDEEGDLFAFTCTSNFVALAKSLELPRSKLGTCMDSGATRDYCPDHTKFTNYKSVKRQITTADGRSLSAVGMGDLHLELPNRSGKTKTVFQNAIHTPDMAFTLIFITRLNKARYSVTFKKGMCIVKNPKDITITTIPHSDRLYKIVAGKQQGASKTANAASVKMSISKAHRKLGHISILAIKHAVYKGLITGIEVDFKSKFDFCEACVKAKSTCQPF